MTRVALLTRCCRLGVRVTSRNVRIRLKSSAGYEAKHENIVNLFPARVQPYLRLARLDRPIGSWLLFWPCAWSIGLAADPGALPSLLVLGKFGLGSVLMRGAGCTINDMWDKDFDKQVARTASRPIASGDITVGKATVFLGAQLSAALAILLSLNQYSVLLGVASLPLVILYPLAKRVTFWPQAILGLTFNWGALMGYSAVRGWCDWSVCVPLYLATMSWTLMYDTVYAFQDIDDDSQVGVKSTALLMGYSHAKPWLALFASGTTCGLLVTGANGHMTWPYYLGVAIVTAHMVRQVSCVDLTNPVDCLKKFRSSSHIGAILFIAILAAGLTKHTIKTRQDENRFLNII